MVFAAVVAIDAVEQNLPVGRRKAAQGVTMATELQTAFNGIRIESLPDRLGFERQAGRKQAPIGNLRLWVIRVVTNKIVVKIGDGSGVGAVVGTTIRNADGAPGNKGGEFVVAELAIMLDEAADNRIKSFFFGNIKR